MMRPNEYDQGDSIRISAVSQALNAQNVMEDTDPSALILKVINPDGLVMETYTWADNDIERETLGHFHCDVVIGSSWEEGWYTYRWEATGTLIAAQEGKFFVWEASG